MSSTSSAFEGPPELDDRTTKARIRDAAIECFARNGVTGTTARRVAQAAGVSAGLVMHHYGSMEGLRIVCDEHVAATIRRFKHDALGEGPTLDVLGALRGVDAGPVMGYLAAVLSEDSPAVASLVDELVADAEAYLDRGVQSGMVLPSGDPRGRAAVMMVWSLGALVLHRHLHRILGVELTDPEVVRDASFAAYAGPAYEIMSDGILTDDFGTQVKTALEHMPGAGEPIARREPTETTTLEPNTESKEG